MTRSLIQSSRLSFEHLEPKQMLAGDVTVSVVEGNLIIQGDELGNQIAITAGEQPGQYVVQGLEGTMMHLVTSIDPLPTSRIAVEGVRHNVRIGMGAGDDSVMIHDAGFRGNVGIGTNGGNDVVRIGVRPELPTPTPAAARVQPSNVLTVELPRPSVAIRGNLTIVTGEQDDWVQIPRAAVAGRLHVSTGVGNDRVNLGPRMDEPGLAIVAADTISVMPSVAISGGITADLGTGTDGFVARGVRSPLGISVLGGEGRDEIVLQHVHAGLRLSVDAGPGEVTDFVGLTRVEAQTALVRTGAGNDAVRVSDSAFGLLGVLLEGGNDMLALHGVKSRATLLSGGVGEDTLTLLGENLLGIHFIDGFEHRGPVG
jgi:hypothetical protein